MKRIRTTTKQASAEERDFRTFLRERFRAAKRRNPRFSLRSFALQLGINHSTLSQILRNKRAMSIRSIETMARKLGLNETLIESYKHGSKRRAKTTKPTDTPVLNFQFDLDSFQLLSAWWHQAILELIHTREFQTDSRWIARRLGISVDDVNIALQRLLRLGLLEMTAARRWIDKSGDAEFQTAVLPATAALQVNQEVHELAIETLKARPLDSQAHAHMVVAIDSKRLPELRAAAEQFMNEVRSLIEESNSKDEVYEVAVSFFPLSKS